MGEAHFFINMASGLVDDGALFEHQTFTLQSLNRSLTCLSADSDGLPATATLDKQESLHLTIASERQLCWDKNMLQELELPSGYLNVAVLLIMWKEDEFAEKSLEEVGIDQPCFVQ